MKKLLEMQLDTGESVFMEVEGTSSNVRGVRGETEDTAVHRFDLALGDVQRKSRRGVHLHRK